MNALRVIGRTALGLGAAAIAAFAALYWRAHQAAARTPMLELHDRHHGRGEVFDMAGLTHQITDAALWYVLAIGVAVAGLGWLILSTAGRRRRDDA